MQCRRLEGFKHRLRSRPPYSARACAGLERLGNDGLRYRSEPNDAGQFVWRPVREGLRERIGRRLADPRLARWVAKQAVTVPTFLAARKLVPNVPWRNSKYAFERMYQT